ncbi:MAG: hypothetical protein SGILL_000739 [Bacillariaceae sp.]
MPGDDGTAYTSDNEPAAKKIRAAVNNFPDLKSLCSALNMHPDNINIINSSTLMDRAPKYNFVDCCVGKGPKGASDVAQVQLGILFKFMMKEEISKVQEVNKCNFLAFYNVEVWMHQNTRKHDIPYVDTKDHLCVEMAETAYGPPDDEDETAESAPGGRSWKG